MQKVADIYESYDREKSKKLLFDFDDLLVETYRLLSENDEVRDKYQGTFRHLLVDEFQDINPILSEILKILINNSEEGNEFLGMRRRLAVHICIYRGIDCNDS